MVMPAETAPKKEATPAASATTKAKAFTEEEVQARISAATSTTQKQLNLEKSRADTAARQAEELQQNVDRLTSRVQVLTKASEFAGDAEVFADWKEAEEARVLQTQRELGRRAMDVTRSELALAHGVPKEVLMGATSEAEMYRLTLEYHQANPSTSTIAETPHESSPATTEPSVAEAPPPTPQIDRGGAGNVGGAPPAKGKEGILAGLRENAEWASFLDKLPE